MAESTEKNQKNKKFLITPNSFGLSALPLPADVELEAKVSIDRWNNRHQCSYNYVWGQDFRSTCHFQLIVTKKNNGNRFVPQLFVNGSLLPPNSMLHLKAMDSTSLDSQVNITITPGDIVEITVPSDIQANVVDASPRWQASIIMCSPDLQERVVFIPQDEIFLPSTFKLDGEVYHYYALNFLSRISPKNNDEDNFFFCFMTLKFFAAAYESFSKQKDIDSMVKIQNECGSSFLKIEPYFSKNQELLTEFYKLLRYFFIITEDVSEEMCPDENRTGLMRNP